MPAITVTANTSGAQAWALTSGSAFKGHLEGLKIDNRSVNAEKIEGLDCFTTDASKTNAAGAAQAAEDFQSIVGSGKVRFQVTVPANEFVSLGKEDLKEINFLGTAYIRGSVTTSDCVVTVQYSIK